MKKYLINILLFFIAIAALDILYGLACQYMNDHSKGGGVQSRYYVNRESKEDILIFGSSRAKHHYVPDVIEDSLRMTCYNAGEDGNGIIYCYGVLKMVTERYAPKIIFYDVTRFDFIKDDNTKYLDLLKPYYYEHGIDSIFWSIEPKTRVMMLSNLYRFNTTCFRVFGNYIRSTANAPKGYSPLFKTMDYEPEFIVPDQNTPALDNIKLSYFERFIQLCQSYGIQLVCFVSPSYKAYSNEDYYYPIIQLCEKSGTPFYYMEAVSDISSDRSFFQDKTHMNDRGARMYTQKVVDTVSENIKIY